MKCNLNKCQQHILDLLNQFAQIDNLKYLIYDQEQKIKLTNLPADIIDIIQNNLQLLNKIKTQRTTLIGIKKFNIVFFNVFSCQPLMNTYTDYLTQNQQENTYYEQLLKFDYHIIKHSKINHYFQFIEKLLQRFQSNPFNDNNHLNTQKDTHKKLNIRLTYEQELANCSKILIADCKNALTQTLKHLQKATNACRVYFFENFYEDNRLKARKKIEITNDIVAPNHYEIIDYEKIPYWSEKFAKKIIIKDYISNFNFGEKFFLNKNDVKSVLGIPIFVNNQWHGFIGFDDTENKRIWYREDVLLLQTACEIIGTYLSRQQSENTIQEQKNFLNKIIDNLPVGVFAKDVKNDFRYTVWNKKMEDIYGNDRKDIIGKNDYDIYNDWQKADYFKFIDHAIMRGKKRVDIPIEKVITPIAEILSHTVKVPISSTKGEPDTLLFIWEDITEYIKMETELRQQKNFLQALIDYLPVAVFTRRISNNHFVVWNKTAENIFGVPAHKILNTDGSDFFNDRQLKIFHRYDEKIIEKRTTIEAFESIFTQDYTPKKNLRSLKTPLFDTQNNIEFILGISEDITEKRKAQQILSESEEKFRLFAEKSPEGIVILNELGQIVEWNKAQEEITGILKSEVIYLDFWDIAARLLPEKLNTENARVFLKTQIKTVLKGGQADWLNKTSGNIYQTATGEQKIIEANHFIIKSEEKNRLCAIIRDVTKRKKQESAIEQLAMGTAQMLDTDFFQSLVLSLSKSLSVAHAGIAEISNRAKDEMYVIAQWDGQKHIAPYYYSLKNTPCAETIINGINFVPDNVDIIYPLDTFFAENNIKGYWAIALKNSEEKTIGLLFVLSHQPLIVEDWSEYILKIFGQRAAVELERQIAEKELKLSREKYQGLTENTSDLIAEISLKGDYLFLNRQYNEILNRTEALENTSINFFSQIHDKEKITVKKAFQNALRTKENVRFTYRIFTENKQWIWLESNVSFYQKTNKDFSAVVVSRDVTKNKQIEQELIRAKEKSELANQTKSEFLTTISHEIRTPLNAILGFNSILTERLKHKDEYQQFLTGIKNSGYTLLRLINDILDMSKIEAGNINIRKDIINIHELIKEVTLIFKDQAAAKNIEINTYTKAKMLPTLYMDGPRLKQILFNLIGNAVKFTPKGSIKIIINAQKTTPDNLNLIINIKDTGIGIPEDKQKVIFEPFKQQDGKDSRQYGGTGLGLAISKRLIEMMHGKIELMSELNKGSEFKITFFNIKITTNKGAALKFKDQLNPDNILFEPQQVLIIDNIMLNNELIKTFLSKQPLDIIEAPTCNETVEQLQNNYPHLILINIQNKTSTDSIELLNYIRTEFVKFNTIPIIAILESEDLTEIENIKKLCDTLLVKPISKIELFNTLAHYLAYNLKNKIETTDTFITDIDTFLYVMKNKKLPSAVYQEFDNEITPLLISLQHKMSIKNAKTLTEKMTQIADKYNFMQLEIVIEHLKLFIKQFNINKIEKMIKKLQILTN